MPGQRRFLVCRCGVLYERRTEQTNALERGRFICTCGAPLGAWNGLIRLVYRAVGPAPADTAEISAA